MRLSTSTPGPRSIAQAALVNSQTITPNAAFADLLRINPFVSHGVPTRVTATIAVTLTGTTLTTRMVFFRLVQGAGAGTTLQGVPFNLDASEAATSIAGSVAMSFILLTPPALLTDQFALQWSTGADATANVNGTDPNTGGAVLNVEELTSLNTTVGPLGDEIFIDTRQANNPFDVLRQVQQSFATVLLLDRDIQLVDIVLSGGGAGNVFLVEMMYRFPQNVEDVSYPKVSTLAAAVGFGPDNTTNDVSLNRIRTDNPAGVFEFWANGCAGDGALWMTLLIYVPGPPPGPTFALRAAVRAARGLPVPPTTPIAKVQSPTAKVPTTVLSFKPADFRTPPPPTPPATIGKK